MKPSSFSKSEIENTLATNLNSLPEASAAWFGGSRATNSEDIFSDTDLVIVSRSPDIVFSLVEEVLQQKYTISHTWIVQGSIWKHMNQKFYVLSEAPATYYLDISIFNTANPQDVAEFFNYDRHGHPQILFDKEGLLQRAASAPSFATNIPIHDANFKARLEVLYRTFLKDHQRQRYHDTVHFYDRLVSLWVQMKRAQYTPQKHDFGLRYIYRDFPKSEAEKLTDLLRARDFDVMKARADEIYAELGGE